MSRKSIHDVKNYNFSQTDMLFLDTNIWMYLYGPQPTQKRDVKAYSDALARALEAKSRIYINITIVSEFINASIKAEANLHKEKYKKFKDFRKSSHFKTAAKETSSAVNRILKICTRKESGFVSLDIEALLGNYAQGHADFNDLAIVDLCQRQKLKLITNDGDFKNQDISILTANKKMLK